MKKIAQKEYWKTYRSLRTQYDDARIRYDNALAKFPGNHPICLFLERSVKASKDRLDHFVGLWK